MRDLIIRWGFGYHVFNGHGYFCKYYFYKMLVLDITFEFIYFKTISLIKL